LDRVTKAAVIISALAALAFETIQSSRYEDGILTLALLSALAGWLAGRRWPARAPGTILAVGALVPILWLAVGRRFAVWLLAPWVMALVAAAAPTITGTWQFPRRLRFPLVAWALAVAATWPIVALRELDWTLALLWTRPSVYSSVVHSVSTAVWIAEVAQVHLLGLLWVDWLFGRFDGPDANRAHDFERAIVWPSVAAAVAAGAFAAYQGFFHLGLLSTGRWAILGRAGGTLADANASGMLGALWVAIPIGIALSGSPRTRGWLLTLGAAVIALGVWATGSRTALLAAVIAVASTLHLTIAERRRPVRKKVSAFAAAIVLVLTGAVIAWQPSAVGPLRRIHAMLPDLSSSTLKGVAWELWARDGYGLAAMAAIRDAPWSGVGVGSFHLLSVVYTRIATGTPAPHDNAQNWYRHQLAELGVIGSVGWALWVVLFVSTLWRGRPAAADRARVLTVSYTVIGFGVASLLGMPGQSLQIALAFWTLAFWALVLAGSDNPSVTPASSSAPRRWELLTAIALAVLLAGTTVAGGLGPFRPPFRAARFDQGFRYGLHKPLEGPAGTTRTTAHAVEVPQAPTRWLKLTVWVEHPDADQRPVDVRVWRDHERIIGGRFPRGVPMTRYVSAPGDNRRFVVESTVDRTFQPPGTRGPEVGLNISWEFVNEPPAGSRNP
jgi:O-antigen ligase